MSVRTGFAAITNISKILVAKLNKGLFFVPATCPLQLSGGFHSLSSLRAWPDGATTTSNEVGHPTRRKGLLEALAPVIKCFSPEMSCVTFSHNSLASTGHMPVQSQGGQ